MYIVEGISEDPPGRAPGTAGAGQQVSEHLEGPREAPCSHPLTPPEPCLPVPPGLSPKGTHRAKTHSPPWPEFQGSWWVGRTGLQSAGHSLPPLFLPPYPDSLADPIRDRGAASGKVSTASSHEAV